MKKNYFINFLFVFFFLFSNLKAYSSINNSVIISVGSAPITYLDLVKEMRLVSLLTNNKIDDSNKEIIKTVAVQALIKRKIKEIEISKHQINNYSKEDLENLIIQTSKSIGINKNDLKERLVRNNLNYNYLIEKFKVDLKWNTLIFELYKNKITLNMSEIEDKINSEIENVKPQTKLLLSEIEIIKPQDQIENFFIKIMDSIKNEGFETTARKVSVSKSASKGGKLGWVDVKSLSDKIYNNIKNLKTNEISDPIDLGQSFLILKKRGERIQEKNIQRIKDNIVRMEKQKKLIMFSNSHYSNLERTTQIDFL